VTNQAEDLVAQVDTGARRPTNWQGKFIPIMCFVWAAYQVFIASNLPFTLGILTGSNFFIIIKSEARFVHLAFAIFLAAMAFPLFKNSPRSYIPWYDWALGLVGAGCCLYLLVFNVGIAERAGLPTTADLTISAIGMMILAVSVYRALGLPLVIVASVFVAYVLFGSSPLLPEAVQWKGASFNKAMWHFWMQTEGVFGVALNVSASLIFLFVVFG